MAQERVDIVSRLRGLVKEGRELSSEQEAHAWFERARLAVAAAYGDDSGHLDRFDNATPGTKKMIMTHAQAFQGHVVMLEAFIEDLEQGGPAETRPAEPGGSQVFVVHGRDHGTRGQVADLLHRLDLEPIILDQQTEQGRTVLEKFEDHALQVGYAVILLTPDDHGYGPDEEPPDGANRARQNVILELGYFMGALGRRRTAGLYVEGIELPSDIHGMLFIKLEPGWELRLAKEMRDAGLPVDLNRL